MKPEELARILALGEGSSVEFKAKADAKTVGQQVCAFLNSGGGYLVLGVDAKNEPVGITKDPDESALRKLEQQIAQGLVPKALVSFETQFIAGKTLWVVEVPAGQDIPYSFRDEAFIREGEMTRRADVATLRDMIMRREVEPERWERRFSNADLHDDLDENEIRRAAQQGESVRHVDLWGQAPVRTLEYLGLAKYGRLTNGGDVLFASNPARRYPQIRVRCAAFSTDKTDDTYGDFKNFEGPLVTVLDKVFAFIRRNTPSRSHFGVDPLKRDDQGTYPDGALREALVNAFAHRDYADFRGGIRVQVFPHRVEIWNSGSLPEGVTPDGLINGQISILRNPDIAHVLYLQGLMEKLGRGGLLISHAFAEQGLPPPEWQSDAQGVTLTLRTPEVTPEVAPEVTPEVTPEVIRLLDALVGDLSRKELQQVLELKDAEHFRKSYLRPALAAGVVEMTQPDKPSSSKQRYRLTIMGRGLQNLNRKP
ncbi:Fic family protein [Pseudomonas sp. L1(2025)]|uniref:Fic family protein n=1 Tax=Pseudomonas sp. L1(2025) TaxID=3449429 RepID=UPI003F6942B8